MKKKERELTPKQALPKIAAFCAYQDRSRSEVEQKLYAYGLSPQDVEDLLLWLEEEKFLDEERFARSFVRGKFQRNKWGRRKILQGLKLKKVPSELAYKAMEEINPEVYDELLLTVVQKKMSAVKDTDPRMIRKKCFDHALSKGFEADLVQDAITELMKAR